MRNKKCKKIRKQLQLDIHAKADYHKIPRKKYIVPGDWLKDNPELPKEITVYQYVNKTKYQYRRIKKELTNS